MENIIKLDKSSCRVHTGNSVLLWIECEILEHITASYLNINNKRISFAGYLKNFKFYKHSVAYGLSKNEYLKFKTYLINSTDYVVGNEALRKSFVFLDEISKISDVNYISRYKKFSEEAWRDLLCKEQFIFIDNEFREYILLFHLLWEIKNNKYYELIDYDT